MSTRNGTRMGPARMVSRHLKQMEIRKQRAAQQNALDAKKAKEEAAAKKKAASDAKAKEMDRLLAAAEFYSRRKRWTGHSLSDDEKDTIREAIKGGATPQKAAEKALG